MATRNPALNTQIVGNVALYYKDVNEALTYTVDVTALLAANETVDINSVTVTFIPPDPTIDVTVAATPTSITVYVDEGGVVNSTYEFTIDFDSNLGNPYIDYFRMSVKQVYKQC